MKLSSVAVCAVVVVVVAAVLLSQESTRAQPVTCSPFELSSCSEPIKSGTAPSETCCEKLREQTPCLCEYIRNPAFKEYVNSTNAIKVASTCGVPLLKC